ncbi:hypothetical protein Nlim_1056 [Candidatus Nitrosarchaeum limnium SFB1]|jgi:hypothetical protein|uniref:Uncharacterized protein n=1 Tax=Candidatus Nitrosarchaeum limnium SFB1 TaxID=886738 RepID=F3KKN2_9ARCH|nr:hypothetical protein Nlim_1056 [Candidatus Nitrosarchaeum limnium SFB1]
MSLLESIFEKKSNLFSIITLSIIAIVSIPIIIPHILHTSHFLHISLHIGELILAVFIGILSMIAYYRMRTKRLLLTMAAFSTFIAVAVVNLIESVWSSYFYVGELSLIEISHILIFVTIGMLALGAFRND